MLPPIQRNYYVFREARNVLELKSLLELRYRGYLQSRCSRLIKQNPSGLDIDSYDLRSRHMGFFQLQGNESKPLGYMRLVEDELTDTAPMIWQLALRHPELAERLEHKPPTPLPLMENCPKTDELMQFFHHLKDKGEKLVEGSRFVFDKDVRSRGFPKFVLESAVAITLYSLGYKHALLACIPRHARFYEKFGFKTYTGLEDFKYCGITGCVLINSKNSVPVDIQQKIADMAKAYDKTGVICHFPEHQNQFQMPVLESAKVPEPLAYAN